MATRARARSGVFSFANTTAASEKGAVSKSLKNISVVATATMASRVLGLLRESLTAAVFGTSALASAYATAFQLPNLFRRLLAEGGMTAAFVPTLNDEIERRKREGAFTLISQVSSWLFVASGALVVVSMAVLGQPKILEWLGNLCHAEVDTIERWQLAAKLAVILFPYLVFVSLAAAFSAALQTLNRFLEPALSPIWLNLSMIGFLVAAMRWTSGAPIDKMYWFCGGVLLGGFLQMAVPAWALTQEGWRPRFDLTWSEPVKMIVRLMAPTVLGSSVYLINMVVSRFIGLSLNDAAVSVLNYASRLMELPIGVFAVAVSTVVFPQISRFAAQGNLESLGSAYRKGMRLILFINVPAAVGLAVLSEPIIRLLFQHGAFHRRDTAMMTPVLIVFAAGLPFFSFVNLVLRAFYAQKDTMTPVRAAVLSFVINVVLSVVLMQYLGTVGLALAGNLAIVVQAWYLQVKLTRKTTQLGLHHLGSDLFKIVFSSAIMGGAVWFGWYSWSHYMKPGSVNDAVAIVLLVTLGVSIYATSAWICRVEGRQDAEQILSKFKTKLGFAASRT
ncbi:MAG TPA: murein biosynthesis integral membrane protein MurJ [Opitutaceae bacterium]|nr:murein biosynthesis integral membrane protein MurJ [Opitutaceae bacterium]